MLLWKVPMRRWGWRVMERHLVRQPAGRFPLNIQKRLVAMGDKVYVTLGYQAPVRSSTTRTASRSPGTERTNEILLCDGRLFLSVLTGEGARVMALDGRRQAAVDFAAELQRFHHRLPQVDDLAGQSHDSPLDPLPTWPPTAAR